jgi:hypothetical protein
LVEALEARQLFTGLLAGNVYVDRNGSLSHNAGDAGYAGFPGPSATVYIDSNNNSTLDAGEPSTTPDGLGNYSFGLVSNGVYVVRLLKPTGFMNMAPQDGAAVAEITTHAGATVDFGIFPTTFVPQGAGTNDSFSVMADPSDPTRTLINSNAPINYTPLSIPSNLLPSLTFTGLGGNDSLTVDERNGACITPPWIAFDDGTGQDTLNYYGRQSDDLVTLRPNTLLTDHGGILHVSVDVLNVDGAGGNDSFMVNGSGTTLGLNISGGDGNDHFGINDTTINTAVVLNGGFGNDEAAIGDSVSVMSALSLRFNGGADSDTIRVYGNCNFPGTVFDGGSGSDDCYYYADGSTTPIDVTATGVRQSFQHGVSCSSAGALDILVIGTSENETINVTTPEHGPGVLVTGGAGDDVLNVTSQWTFFAADPIFNLGPGNDQLNVLSGRLLVDGDAGVGGSNLAVQVNSGANVLFGENTHLASLSISSGANALLRPNANMRLVTRGLTLTGTGTLDLYDNDMILDYTGASPLSTIQGYINTARSGGTWLGNGITSYYAQTSNPRNKTLGAMEASDYHGIYGGGATFDGEPIDNSAVLVKFTYYGDTDFNGRVNFDDYVRIDNGFNNQLTGWLNGDFDGNGRVNFDDYVLIDLAFNTQGSAL